jgi:hypothetical protein
MGFEITVSPPATEVVTFDFATADVTATAGSDYVATAGSTSIGPGMGVIILVKVIGDVVPEPNETFSVKLGNVSRNGRIADGQGVGVIVNDDGVGSAELTPRESRAHVGRPTAVTLTWTHPERWRDLDTVDLRLLGSSGVALWLRFHEEDNTFALIDSDSGMPGPGFVPGTDEELRGELLTVLLGASSVQAAGADAPRVDLMLTLRFAPEAVGTTYDVEAAATDDAGNVQEFETVGAVTVLPAEACAGDCDGDLTVAVDELIIGASIALKTAAVDACPAFDTDGNGAVEVDEIIAAVGNALAGCKDPTASQREARLSHGTGAREVQRS